MVGIELKIEWRNHISSFVDFVVLEKRVLYSLLIQFGLNFSPRMMHFMSYEGKDPEVEVALLSTK